MTAQISDRKREAPLYLLNLAEKYENLSTLSNEPLNIRAILHLCILSGLSVQFQKDFNAFHQFSYAEQADVIEYLDEKIEILKNAAEKKRESLSW